MKGEPKGFYGGAEKASPIHYYPIPFSFICLYVWYIYINI